MAHYAVLIYGIDSAHGADARPEDLQVPPQRATMSVRPILFRGQRPAGWCRRETTSSSPSSTRSTVTGRLPPSWSSRSRRPSGSLRVCATRVCRARFPGPAQRVGSAGSVRRARTGHWWPCVDAEQDHVTDPDGAAVGQLEVVAPTQPDSASARVPGEILVDCRPIGSPSPARATGPRTATGYTADLPQRVGKAPST